jgi:mono/diheme cytochrome c family protein
MRRALCVTTPVGLLLMLTAMAAAQPVSGVDPKPDARTGERLARQWCASCHVVAAGQAQASTAVPTFAEIARRPAFDGAQLALFLLNPHPVMPNMALTRTEAADLAAYIGQMRN